MKSKSRLLALLATLAVAWMTVGPTQVGGATTYVTTHGDSMEPSIHAGDLVLVRAAAEYRVGDAVAYRSGSLDTVVLHRIVAVEDGRFTLQGDNNDWLDPEQPSADQIIGRQWLRIPQGGTWLRRATSPPALAGAAFVLIAAGSHTGHLTLRRRRNRRLMAQQNQPVLSTSRARRLRPALRQVALGAAATGLIGATLGVVAWTRPSHEVVTDTAVTTTTVDFSYSTEVPRSAAYDGTTVRDPQPVFRTLADSVEVRYEYEGRPGTVTVDADLSTAGGWRSTVRLADPVAFEGRRHVGTVTLDLDDLQARADAAVPWTGVAATQVNIAVVPRVSVDGGGLVEPRLDMVLDPNALRLAGDDSLTVEESTSVTDSTPQPARLAALGRSIDVTTARWASLLLLALAAVVGGAAVSVTRLAGGETEQERTRRRHGALLLPVLPIALPEGRPVIDVYDLGSLAKLAERHGLMVLWWSRSGVDTYVVQEESTTYRYRTGDRRDTDDTAAFGASDAASDTVVKDTRP